MVHITIKTDNAAFSNDDGEGKAEGPEVARILRHLADRVENATVIEGYACPCIDANGNTVGKFEATA
jgi:hypothetical protein